MAINPDPRSAHVFKVAIQWARRGCGSLRANAFHQADTYALTPAQRECLAELIADHESGVDDESRAMSTGANGRR